MQAHQELPYRQAAKARWYWNMTGKLVLFMAERMEKTGIHKQVINRMIEPWTHINVLVTATEWENFLKLRTDKAAQPEIRELALKIEDALETAEYKVIQYGDWHLPYITDEEKGNLPLEDLQLISAARCARLSYTPFGEPKPNTQKDLALAHRLLAEQHLSPFEHQATPKNRWNANFKGWQSYRNKQGH